MMISAPDLLYIYKTRVLMIVLLLNYAHICAQNAVSQIYITILMNDIVLVTSTHKSIRGRHGHDRMVV
jgi:hypothetical protein